MGEGLRRQRPGQTQITNRSGANSSAAAATLTWHAMLLWKFDKGRSETFLRVFKLRRRKRISQSTTKPPPILSAAANCACNCRANSASPAVASAPREPPLANTELEPLAAIVFSADAVDATADADSSCALCSLHRRPTSTITCFCGVPAGSDRAMSFM